MQKLISKNISGEMYLLRDDGGFTLKYNNIKTTAIIRSLAPSEMLLRLSFRGRSVSALNQIVT